MKKSQTQTVFFLIAFTLMSAWANANETRNVTEVKDVETLNDDLSKYSGQVVRVSGKVEDKIDSRSIVLESGGIFNDEIVVISGPKVKGTNIGTLKEDAKVVVTGTVVMKTVTDFQKEYNWTMTPEMAGEFTDTRAFLVADEIAMVRK